MKINSAVLLETGKPAPYAASQPLQIQTLELAEPQAGEVLVKIRAAGLCHSDLSVINGDRPRPLPMALGHEAAAEVLRCGAGVNDLQAGDQVVLVFVPSCGHCAPCVDGRPALCEPAAVANTAGNLLCGEKRLSLNLNGKIQAVHHHVGVCAFSEYAVVSRHSCVKIDQPLPYDEAALFGCAILTGVGAVFNTARVQTGSSAAIVGLGGVGLAALLGAVAAGAYPIVAIDLHDEKLRIAKELGASHVFNARDANVIEAVKAATGGGVEYGFEMAGAVQAMELAYRVTRRGGTTVTAGLSHPDARWALQHVNLVAEERTVKGSYIGSCVPARDIPRFVALYRAGKLPVNKLMGTRYTLSEINAGFDELAQGHSLRGVVVFD